MARSLCRIWSLDTDVVWGCPFLCLIFDFLILNGLEQYLLQQVMTKNVFADGVLWILSLWELVQEASSSPSPFFTFYLFPLEASGPSVDEHMLFCWKCQLQLGSHYNSILQISHEETVAFISLLLEAPSHFALFASD